MSRIQRAGDERVLVWEPYQYRSTTKTRPSLGFEVWEPYQYRSTTKTRPSLGFEGGGAKSIGDSAPSSVA